MPHLEHRNTGISNSLPYYDFHDVRLAFGLRFLYTTARFLWSILLEHGSLEFYDSMRVRLAKERRFLLYAARSSCAISWVTGSLNIYDCMV